LSLFFKSTHFFHFPYYDFYKHLNFELNFKNKNKFLKDNFVVFKTLIKTKEKKELK